MARTAGGNHAPQPAAKGKGWEEAEGEGGGEGVKVGHRNNEMVCAHIDELNHSLWRREVEGWREEEGGGERIKS